MDEFILKPCRPAVLKKKINELTVKAVGVFEKDNMLNFNKERPMNHEELQELRRLKEKGLTRLKLIGTNYSFIVHKNIQNKISYDLVGMGRELTEFIDRNETEPGRCHLYKTNLYVTKDLFLPDELEQAIQAEDRMAMEYVKPFDKKIPE